MHGAVASQQKPVSLIPQNISLVQKKARTLNGTPVGSLCETTFDVPPKAGNLLLMVISTLASTLTFTPPAGWTTLIFMDSSGDTVSPMSGAARALAVAYKIAVTGEPSLVSCSITYGTLPNFDMMIFEYYGPYVLDVQLTAFKASALFIDLGPTSTPAEANELSFVPVGISTRTGQSFSNGYTRENADNSRAMIGTKILTTVEAALTTAAWTSSAIDSVAGMFMFRTLPTSISGLQAWYDASDSSSITDVGAGAVSAWNDKSGNGRHLSQATSGNRPTTGTRTSTSGRNMLDFNGTTNYMDTASFVVAQPLTVFVVLLADVAAGKMSVVARINAADNWRVQKNSSGLWELWGGVALIGPAANTAQHRFTTVSNGASSSLRIDGSATNGNGGTNGISDGIRIGRGPSAFTDYWNGPIGEILIYSGAVSAGNITTIETYLQQKWG